MKQNRLLLAVKRSAPKGEERARLVTEGLWSRRPAVFQDKRSKKLKRIYRKEMYSF